MSDDSPWPRQGSYIPFPKPIPAVTTDPTGSPDFELCLHIDWQPAVIGALKALTRPESWSGSQADIDAAVHGAYQLLASIVEPCNCGAPGLPFACPGDAGPVSSPYGAWACPTWGTYVFGNGWQDTMAGYGGYNWEGVELFIDLIVPVNLRHVTVLFDYVAGHAEVPSDYQGEVIDQTHGTHLVGPLRFSDMSTGYNQAWNWAGVADGVQHLKIGLFDSQMADSLPGTGVSLIKSVRIDGYTIPPNPGPC